MNDRSPLDVLVDDVRDELADVETPLPRGLADLFARAAALDPSFELGADDAARLDGLADDAVERVAAIGSLDTLIASARAELGAIADEAQPGPVPAPRRDHGRAWIAGVVAVAAALLLVALSTWSLRESWRETPRADDYSGANQTAREDATERAVEIEPPPAKPRVIVPVPEPTPEPTLPEAPAPLDAGKPKPTPQAIEARLEQLDREARDAWKRGELATAESGFEAVVKSGGRRAIADLAFGDLFELARQRKDTAGESALWRRYVRRFPSGRYVDEARAGLCRRESGDAAKRCWSAYLADRPQGTYRDQAARAIGESPP
jgi:hypothetical protein